MMLNFHTLCGLLFMASYYVFYLCKTATMQSISSYALLQLFSLCLPLLLSLFFIKAQSSDPLDYCYLEEDGEYEQGSLYESNLKSLLNSLASNTRLNDFYNTSSGNDTDQVYGLIQCRGDISEQDCRTCQTNSTEQLPKNCPYSKKAQISYDYCWLSYDYNLSMIILGIGYYQEDGTKSDSFIQGVRTFFNNLTSTASAVSNPSRLDSGYSGGIYGLAQCARESTEDSCSDCLHERITYISGLTDQGKTYYRALTPVCFVRYETYPFFDSSSLAPAEAPEPTPKKSGRTLIIAIVISIAVILVLISSICIFLFWRRRMRRKSKLEAHNKPRNDAEEDLMKNIQTVIFDLSSLRVATNDFSDSCKLGEGGFGSVYKGNLPDGQEIAVKRLSQKSGQGLEELKTEVVVVAKLLHKNLVKLLGFCLEDEEKLLVYEYHSNGSLDHILFDQNMRLLLGWDERYKIIIGIARGLLYLHEDSQLRIIHRDLKASNILLDDKMNAKISDFGLARLFAETQAEVKTRIAGTLGYIAPECFINGSFSTKSDVFSFGVLLLEIVVGRRNSSFHDGNLISYAWKHWSNGTAIEIVDTTLGLEWLPTEMLKSIQIGLLCVEQNAHDRPTMSQVLFWFSTHGVTCPPPTRPAFVTRDGEFDQSGIRASHQSINVVTISDVDPR